MSNSKLINYTRRSPNCNIPRNHRIDTITIHHMAGNLTVEQCGELFANPNRQVSSNYAIGTDGRVALYVDEANRSWCTSSPENDNRAITIEVANDKPSDAGGWHVSDKALAKLIDLCVDICKRNGIKKLNYTGDKSGNLTMHKWFAATGCPGPYLSSKFPYIANEVNKRLNATSSTSSSTSSSSTKTSTLYRIRKSWSDASSQIGAYSTLEAAKKACKAGYSVYDNKGKEVYTIKANAKTTTKSYSAGTKLSLKNIKVYVSATASTNTATLTGTYYIYDSTVTNGRLRITNNKNNVGKTPAGNYVSGWVNKKDI